MRTACSRLLNKTVCLRVSASPLGRTFQAIVSVMAVKIQLSSPRGVRLSLSLPGILQHTQHNTDGCVSRAHCMSHSLLRGQSGNCSVLSSQHIWKNLHLHLGAYLEAEKKWEAGYVCTHTLVCRTHTVTLWAQDPRHRATSKIHALFSSDHMWEPRAKGFRLQSSRNKLQVDFLIKLITNQFVRASVIVNSN